MIIRFFITNIDNSVEQIDLEIDLIKNPAVDSWVSHFSPKYITSAKFNCPRNIKTLDQKHLASLLDICNSNLKKLTALGYSYNGPLAVDTCAIDRNFTNKLHRYFTHTIAYVSDQIWPNLSREEHDTMRRYLSDILEQINIAVHEMELYLPTRKECLLQIEEVYINNEPNTFETSWWDLKKEWRCYHSKQHADVVLGSQIQGKTILRSYLDNDDPNDIDTSGHYCSAGALQILPTDTRYKIYTSEDFLSWLSQHNLQPDTVYYDFPIGNVKNKDTLQYLMEKIYGSFAEFETHYIF